MSATGKPTHEETADAPDIAFSPLLVSTVTSTAFLGAPVNILDVAKYLPLDDVVVGAKIVYAGNLSFVLRKQVNMPKKTSKRDFSNQATFSLLLSVPGQLPPHDLEPIFVSCKIFHTGKLHVTGTHDTRQAAIAANELLRRIKALRGCKLVRLKPDRLPLLVSHDHLVYDRAGNVIGWERDPVIFVKGQRMRLEKLQFSTGEEYTCLVAEKWDSKHSRVIYTLDGEVIGRRKLALDISLCRRNLKIEDHFVYAENKIVGRVVTCWDPPAGETLLRDRQLREWSVERAAVVHPFSAVPNDHMINGCRLRDSLSDVDFAVHNINSFFRADMWIHRQKLYRVAASEGYYCNFDPDLKSGVYVKFHHAPRTDGGPQDDGIPLDESPQDGLCRRSSGTLETKCACKVATISIFHTGAVNVTGIDEMHQGHDVYDFVRQFLTRNRSIISP